MLIKLTMEEFKEDLDNLLDNVIWRDKALSIKTENGNAIIITEDEWLLLRDGFLMSRKPKNKK